MVNVTEGLGVGGGFRISDLGCGGRNPLSFRSIEIPLLL
jgi:hypothetical protein